MCRHTAARKTKATAAGHILCAAPRAAPQTRGTGPWLDPRFGPRNQNPPSLKGMLRDLPVPKPYPHTRGLDLSGPRGRDDGLCPLRPWETQKKALVFEAGRGVRDVGRRGHPNVFIFVLITATLTPSTGGCERVAPPD